jgi:hypothetical protein
MHPTPAFRHDDRALSDLLIGEISSGMILAAIPDGPHVARTPLPSTGSRRTRLIRQHKRHAERLRVAAALPAWEAKGLYRITHVMRQSGEAA